MIHRVARKRRAVLRHPLVLAALLGSALVVAFAISGSAVATTVGPPVCAATTPPNTLAGSRFEIDTDANLVVDSSTCIDWLADGTGSALRTGVLAKADKLTGSGDDSFGQGTSENDANPTIVSGSIPPNKSDLKIFGLYQEQGEATTTPSNPTGKFLELFWSRVQNPSGTTNMDFELNQKFCDPSATPPNCAINSKDPSVTPETPVRTAGDKLITYDLSKGGTVPTISIRTWLSTGVWSAATVISGGTNPAALGSVNTSTIASADSGGSPPAGVGSQDPFTFGEASITFGALFGTTTCGSFGSAYLKSRSSDSFTAEIKDFIAPEHVTISNCSGLTTSATASVSLGNPISDDGILTGVSASAGGTITFHLFPSLADCNANTNEINTGLTPVTVSGPNTYNSGNFTPSAVGTYYWTASYSGDGSNSSSSTACGDTGESSVVTTVPTATTTRQFVYPQDKANIAASAGGNLAGSVRFRLYDTLPNCTADSGTAAGGMLYQELGSAHPISGGSPQTATTNNTTVAVTSNTTVYWRVFYDSTNPAQDDSSSACTESTQVTYAGNDATITVP
jgi:hypothetical protein